MSLGPRARQYHGLDKSLVDRLQDRDAIREMYGQYPAECEEAAKEIVRLQAALNEVVTNGEWTKGEQLGDWAISKDVYETVRDALNEQVSKSNYSEIPSG